MILFLLNLLINASADLPSSVIYQLPEQIDLAPLTRTQLGSFIHPEYGTLFQYHNSFLHNLQIRYLEVAIPLPNPTDLDDISVPAFHDCMAYASSGVAWSVKTDHTRNNYNLNILHDTCAKLNVMHARVFDRIIQVTNNIKQRMTRQQPSILPHPTTFSDNTTTITFHSGEVMNYHHKNATYSMHNSTHVITKRAILLPILQGISAIASVGFKAASFFMKRRSNRSYKAAIDHLYKNHNALVNTVNHNTEVLDDKISSFAKTTFKELEVIHERFDEHEYYFGALNITLWDHWYEFNSMRVEFTHILNSLINSHHFYLKDYTEVLDKIMDVYNSLIRYEAAYGDWLSAMDSLANGRLSHNIIDPTTLSDLLSQVVARLERNPQNAWELAQPNVNHYYSIPLVTFTNTPKDLIVQIPVFLKLKEIEPKSLYSIQTVPVPFNTETYEGLEHTFTQVKIEEEYIALSRKSYVLIHHTELQRCTLLRDIYYCEGNFLTRSYDALTCSTAIFLDKSAHDITTQCDASLLVNFKPRPWLLDADHTFVISGVYHEWNLVCGDTDRVFPVLQTPYTIINRTELCDCSLTAGPYYLPRTLDDCNTVPSAQDGRFQTHYVASRIVLDYLTVRYNISFSMPDAFLDDPPISYFPNLTLYDPPHSSLHDRIFQHDYTNKQADLERTLDILLTESDALFYTSAEDILLSERTFYGYLKEASWYDLWDTFFTFLGTFFCFLFILSYCGFFRFIRLRYCTKPSDPRGPPDDASVLPRFYDQMIATGLASVATLPGVESLDLREGVPVTPPPSQTDSTPVLSGSISPFHYIQIVTMSIVAFYFLSKAFYKLYIAIKGRAGDFWTACFPLYPVSRFLRGDCQTDLYLQVMQVSNAKVLWAHVTQVAYHPNALTFIGSLDTPDLHYTHGCLCLHWIDINWSNTQLVNHLGHPITLPRRAFVSVHDTGLHALDRYTPYEITLHARYLGLDYTIARASTYSPTTPPQSGTQSTHHTVDVVI